jgi:uncharacterized membrane protein
MKQDDINKAEWRNPANWSWRGLLGLYFSKGDTRIVVPKARPVMGWTLNFAHPASAYILIAILLLPIVLVAAVQLLA